MKYFELEPEQNTFQTLLADVTHRCNMNCANCYVPNRLIPDMDVEKLYAFLARLPRRTDIRLIGAEPTMREDLPEIIRNVRKLGHRPVLITNGLKLHREDYVQTLHDAGLRVVGLSMNGADDDAIYEQMDSGRYAKLKTKALRNVLKLRFVLSVGAIIARGVNRKTIRDLVSLVGRTGAELGGFGRLPPLVRFRTVGDIGRHMEGKGYSLAELRDMVCEDLAVDPSAFERVLGGTTTPNRAQDGTELVARYATPSGDVILHLTDWTVDADGVPDPRSRDRGRITPNWKAAPFFEHVKQNEFQY